MAAKKRAKKKRAAAGSKKKSSRRQSSSARKTTSRAKKTARKKTTRKKPAKKKKSAGSKRASKKTKTPKKGTQKKTAAKSASLGRPRLPADAKLDLVFQKDYQAREIFAFLGVSTLRELEAFGPDEIIDRLTSPVVETVQRIRKALALNNRCLKNDRRFARQFQSAWKKGR